MPPLPATIIRHIHLPSITPFHIAQNLQNHLVSQFLTYKASLSTSTPSASPIPTILTFVPTPVYTTGRREHDAISAEQLAILKAPLSPLRKTSHNKYRNPEWAAVVPTLRGGQTTFHGPGQLVVYPILDLKPLLIPSSAQSTSTTFTNSGRESQPVEQARENGPLYSLWPKGLSVRCYVHLLEQSTINTLAHWTLKGIRTSNPGVWEESGERKIAALGVHLRRNITSYGVGLNVATDLQWFDRIVACGLVGKGVVSMRDLGEEIGAWEANHGGKGQHREIEDAALAMEKGGEGRRPWLESLQRKNGPQLRGRLKPGIVAKTWAREFARGLVGEGGEEFVVKVGIEDLDVPEALVAAYKRETETWRNDWEDDW
ncbi:lipoyltransferase [Cadophora sp. DSE1049]|nr:lipoyltransferase [Cadophora sp. DSE1049]